MWSTEEDFDLIALLFYLSLFFVRWLCLFYLLLMMHLLCCLLPFFLWLTIYKVRFYLCCYHHGGVLSKMCLVSVRKWDWKNYHETNVFIICICFYSDLTCCLLALINLANFLHFHPYVSACVILKVITWWTCVFAT